jgi:serine---pyruvate transaminase
MKKNILFTPGPTPIPPEVIEAMSQPIIPHRQQEFKDLFKDVCTKLKYTFQTEREVFVITGSGTAGMETSVCNLFSAGDKILVADAGKFGRRWAEIGNAFGLEVIDMNGEWGVETNQDELNRLLISNKNIKGVFLTHCESSTGVTNDIRKLSGIVRSSSDCLIIVDAISSLAGEELRMDEWGLDVVVSASQKGLMTPPGLAFVALSENATMRLQKSNLPKYYFNLNKSIESQRNFLTPWTPATTLIVGLNAALNIIEKTRLEKIWERNKKYSQLIRESCSEIGFKIFSKNPSNIITAFQIPGGVQPTNFLKFMKENFGVIFAGGQGPLINKIFRISNTGYISNDQVVFMLDSLKAGLLQFNPLNSKMP